MGRGERKFFSLNSVKNTIGILMEDYIEIVYCFQYNIAIFTILSLLIHEHESVFFIFFLRCLEVFFFFFTVEVFYLFG